MEHINSGRSWSPELRVFLIRSVKNKERLWRKFTGVGQDNDARMSLWTEVQQEITDEYNIYVDIEEIKKTWKNLKDNFVRLKKANKIDKPNGKRWFFFEELQFLEYADQMSDYKCGQGLLPDPETEDISIEPPVKRICEKKESYTVSIPIIDNRINTKQDVALGALVLHLDDNLDDIAKMTSGHWGSTQFGCYPPDQKDLLISIDEKPTENIFMEEMKPFIGIESEEDVKLILYRDQLATEILNSERGRRYKIVEQRIVELNREIDRVENELLGQPSVIRRTKLKKMLHDAQTELKTLNLEQEKFTKYFQRRIKEEKIDVTSNLGNLLNFSKNV